MPDPKKIIILGSTGSIGRNAVDIAAGFSGEFRVVGLAADSNTELLSEQARALSCAKISVSDEDSASCLRSSVADGVFEVFTGADAMKELVESTEADIVLCSVVGTAALEPVISAIRLGRDIALASKEILVLAGENVTREIRKSGSRLLPVDSEHSALFQCLEGRAREDVSKLILTASGGPFKDAGKEELEQATWESAMAHPTWNMGAKVTIDSATLMNKALEIVEAHWLFDCPADSIEVIIHPESIIHSMVEFIDGSLLAQMSEPDMRFPILYALGYPGRKASGFSRLNLAETGSLNFEAPDRKRFPSLDFAYEALKCGGTMPGVMNAANEVAVERFRKGEISFTSIWKIIENVMKNHNTLDHPGLDAILSADREARKRACEISL